MSDDPLAPKLAGTPAGIYEHWCERPGCGKWGGWGFDPAEPLYGTALSIEGTAMIVSPPKTAKPYIDRYLDCQAAAEDAFRDLLDMITAAGWTEDEAAYAVTGLAQAHLLARAANEKTERQIREATR